VGAGGARQAGANSGLPLDDGVMHPLPQSSRP